MKPLAYLPHEVDVPKEILSELDALVDFRRIGPGAAASRVPGTKRWIVLYDDGEGLVVFGKEGSAPTIAEVMRAAEKLGKKEVIQ